MPISHGPTDAACSVPGLSLLSFFIHYYKIEKFLCNNKTFNASDIDVALQEKCFVQVLCGMRYVGFEAYDFECRVRLLVVVRRDK